ncbi:MAG: hypothetical protein J5879_10420, partial [Clostridia bacterium]|nr:hypothetical protein [Clostridia bacterium]
KASKPLGFIAAGIFICACLILTSVGLAEGGLDVVQLITGRGDTAVIIMNVIEKVLPPLLAVNVYVSAVLTSIAAAIRRRETVKIADEDSVIS